jgi:hypothetical protein
VRVNFKGLGQAPGCGTDPCDWFDYIWVSDECAAYLACDGQPPMTFSGQLGAGVQSVASGAATVAGSATTGLVSGVVGGLGVPGTIALAGVGIVLLLVALKR